ncbi:unnamed protein product [marine sediment metagenome]|uniref:Uncharacterized protein n=1 Tax=marine sediment metagenome TaxID=412755 RepID=X1RJU2_9ZZZZ
MNTHALTVIDNPQHLALFQQGYVQQYQQEVDEITAKLEEAREALELAQEMSLPSQKTRWEREVVALETQLDKAKSHLVFYSQGFLPLPRMSTVPLQYAGTRIPAVALRRLKDAKDLEVFDDFQVVEAQVNRDPILVGIKRFPDGEEVHCFIAWWR